MQLSYFYNVFLAYVWLSLEAPHLCRSAVVASGKKQNSQQYLTAINTCLQKCSGAVNARRPMMQITEGQRPCYHECLLKIGSLHLTRNQQVKSVPKRMKRDIWADVKQDGDKHGDVCQTSLRTKDALNKTYIHINFLPCTNGSKTYGANVSWTPRPEITSSWTGYKVVYRFKNMVRNGEKIWSPHFCRDVVEKNMTSTIVSIPNEGPNEYAQIWVAVTSLPHTPGNSKAKQKGRYLPEINCTPACDCHPNGTSGQVCGPSGDQCPCNPGYTGPKCNQCATGYYGFPDCRISETSAESESTTTVPVSETSAESESTTTVPVSETTTESKNTTTVPGNLSKEVVIAIGAVAGFCFPLLVAFVCRRRFKEHKRETSFAPLDPDFKFDAFIIYSSVDQKWVTKKLLPTLESKHKIKCCIHYRDFVPGVPFTQNMADSVYNSKKTVAVVSKSFLNSNFCSHELSIALHRLAERGDDSVVVIKLDDVKTSQLPKELRFRSYIDFTKSNDKRSWEYKLVTLFKA